MKRILISLLSDYLQPNFLLIKEFEGKFDEYEKIKSVFSEENFSAEDEYLINLTGGTKVMPLAAYPRSYWTLDTEN